jgi:hypothetical protein
MQTVSNLMNLLFATFPPPPGADVAAQLEAYSIALEGHDVGDIEAAVRKLIRGEVAGHNQSFAPSAATLGAVVIERRNHRLDVASRGYIRNQLPAPTIERTDDSRARVAALVKAVTTVDTEAERIAEDARREGWAKVSARFDADLDALPDSERLKRLGYTTGDSDADGDMGSRAATGG